MPQSELKQVIDYEELENQIISSAKFPLYYFEIKHPENRVKIAAILESSLKLEKHSKALPITNKIFDYLTQLKNQLLQNTIPLTEAYSQIYQSLLTEKNLKLIHQEIDDNFEKQNISLSMHYMVRESIADLLKQKAIINNYVGLDAKIDIQLNNLQEKLLFIKTTQFFAKKSGVIAYLKKTINDGMTAKFKSWEEYADIIEKLSEEKLSQSDQDALTRLKKDLEKLLNLTPWKKICSQFALQNPRDLKDLIEFVNTYYSDFPQETRKNLTEEMLVNKIAMFEREEIKPDISLDVKVMESNSKNFNAYSEVKNEVYNFLNKNKKASLSNDEVIKLWDYIYPLVQKNQTIKNHYLLAFFQYIIQELYGTSASVSHGIRWLNHRMQAMLCEHSMRPEAEHYLVKIMISLLLDMVRPDKILGGVKLFGYNVWEHEQKYPIGQKLYKVLEKSFKDHEYYQANSVKYAEGEAKRDQLLEDLNQKEAQYISDIQNMIPSFFGFTDRDKRLVEKLFARLAGVEYLKDKLKSGCAMNSNHLQHELKILFKDRVLSTRQLRQSHLTKVTTLMDMPEAKIR